MNWLIKNSRMSLAILSCLLLTFGICSSLLKFQLYGSQLLPILASSAISLALLFIYNMIGMGYIKPSGIQENKHLKRLSTIGFGGNVILLLWSLFAVIAFGIIP